jgi:hypothetical protein
VVQLHQLVHDPVDLVAHVSADPALKLPVAPRGRQLDVLTLEAGCQFTELCIHASEPDQEASAQQISGTGGKQSVHTKVQTQRIWTDIIWTDIIWTDIVWTNIVWTNTVQVCCTPSILFWGKAFLRT